MNVRGRDIAGFVAEAQAAIEAQIKRPPGYMFRWGGQFEHLETASRRLAIVVPVAMLLIFLLLYSTFHSMRLAFLIYLAVPMAATGGVFALILRGLPFSISAAVGFIALFGVAVLNGLVWVSAVEHLRQNGFEPHEAASEAAIVRLRPILMTALVAGLALHSHGPCHHARRRDPATSGHGRHRRPLHFHDADLAGAAIHLSLVRQEGQVGRAVMRQNWRELLFLHWAFAPELIRPLIPRELELDLFEGKAYVGLVPFTMTGVRPTGLPAIAGLSSFHETNVRTYVHIDGRDPGVWFFSLDAANTIAVRLARGLFHLPYHRARMFLERERPGPSDQPSPILYAGVRCWPAPLPASYLIRGQVSGPVRPAVPGTLEHFLAERICSTPGFRNAFTRGKSTTRPTRSSRQRSSPWTRTSWPPQGSNAPQHHLWRSSPQVSTSKSTLSAGCKKPNPPDEPIGLMKRPARDAAHAQENLDSTRRQPWEKGFRTRNT